MSHGYHKAIFLISWEKNLILLIRGKIMQKIKWSDVAKELERTSKSNFYKTPKLCRERWNNYLNPELKKFIFFFKKNTKIL